MGLLFNKQGGLNAGANIGMGGGMFEPTKVAPSKVPDNQQHIINSFKTLDSGTRQKLLTSFQKTDPEKYQLLKGYSGSPVTPIPQVYDNSLRSRISRTAQGEYGFIKNTNKAVSEYLLKGAADFLTGDTNQGNNPEKSRVPNAKSLPNISPNKANLQENIKSVKESVPRAIENHGGDIVFSGAAKAYDFAKAAQLLSKGVRPANLVHANLGEMQSILDRNIVKVPVTKGGVKVPVKAYEQPKLGTGETKTPLGLPSKTTVPYTSNRTPGGAVMVDHTSPDAKIVAGSDLAQENGARQVIAQLAKDHAETLRQIHKDSGGVATLKDSEGYTTGKRSQNDAFYRTFFKTNGKPPTKDDWLTEAHRQLSKGDSPEAVMYQHAKAYLENPDRTPTSEAVAAGRRLTEGQPGVTQGAPKAKTNLNELLTRWTKLKNTGDTSKVSQLKTLNDIIEHPEASADIKARAIRDRENIVHQNALDQLAKDHSEKTGQPVASSHETLASGHGEHADLYQAVQASKKKIATIAHDYVPEAAPKPKAAPKEKPGFVPSDTPQNPKKGILEHIIPRKLAGAVNPERAAAREGNIELSKWAAGHQARVNTRTLDSQKATEDYGAILKKNNVTHDQVINAIQHGTDDAKIKEAADFFQAHTKKVGQEGVAIGTQKGYRQNYVPRIGRFEGPQGKGRNAFGLGTRHRFNNERSTIETLDKNGKPVKTDRYKTWHDFTKAVESMGGSVQKDTAKMLGHVLSTEGRAIENQRSKDLLDKVTMRDGRPASVKASDVKPSEFSDYKDVGGKLVHPEAVRLYQAVTETSANHGILGGVSAANSLGKRIITLNGIVHAKNFANASIRNQGLIRTLMAPFGKYSYGDVRRLVEHGFEPSSISESNLYDEFGAPKQRFGKAGEWLGNFRNTTDKWLFHSYGDSLGVSAGLQAEKTALKAGLSADEAAAHGAKVANATIFAIPKGQQSIAMRQASKFALFAGKFLQSTFQMGGKAVGVGLDRTASTAAQSLERKQAQISIARGAAYTFLAAQAINYANTGRFTWENPGDKKLEPVLFKTPDGKEHYGSNFYGQIGDLVKMIDNPVAETKNKLGPGLSTITNLLTNHDPYKYTNNGQITTPTDPGYKQLAEALMYAGNKLVTPYGFSISSDSQPNLIDTFAGGKNSLWTPSTLARLAGFSSTTTNPTKLEKTLNQLYATQPQSPQTGDSMKLSNLKGQARLEIQKGNSNGPAVQQLKKQLTAKQLNSFLATAKESGDQREFEALTTDNKIKLIEQSDPKDLKGLDLSKWLVTAASDYKTGNANNPQELKSAMQKVGVDKSKFEDLLKQGKDARRAQYRANKGKKKTSLSF